MALSKKGLRLLIAVDKSTNKIQVVQMEKKRYKNQQLVSALAIGRLPIFFITKQSASLIVDILQWVILCSTHLCIWQQLKY